jgi:cellulose synthase/poly-beta-1,6-N-acetylglucosamine synthase-like glycosyltransferase
VQGDIQPHVTVIIPAHNEQAIIARKLENILTADYPTDKLEIVVASDCSTDETDAIVRTHGPRVRLVRAAVRSGKQVCLNLAASQATGEILLFTDAASVLAADAVSRLVRHFADDAIGAVSSAIRIRRMDYDSTDRSVTGKTHGDLEDRRTIFRESEGLYLGADCAQRILEGEISSIVGCVGACYAIRRDCFVALDPGDCDDLAAVFSVVACGKRAVMDWRVVCEMSSARDGKIEFARKVRTISGGVDTAWRYRSRILRSAPASLIWFFASHKMCRWMLPLLIFMSCLAVAGGAIWGHWFWRIPLIAGSAISLAAAIQSRRRNRRFAWFNHVSFFLVSMSAGVIAWWQVFAGRKQVVWQPTPRHRAFAPK